MTDLVPLYLSLTAAPAVAGAAAGLILAGSHRADSLAPAPERQRARRQAGRHRKHVRTGESAEWPVSNGYPNPAHRQRRSLLLPLRRVSRGVRAELTLSKWVYLQRDVTPVWQMAKIPHV